MAALLKEGKIDEHIILVKEDINECNRRMIRYKENTEKHQTAKVLKEENLKYLVRLLELKQEYSRKKLVL